MTKAAKLDPNRFEAFVDVDTDGAILRVGLQHHAFGPPSPSIQINTGALEVLFNAHVGDIDRMIEGLREARKELRRLAKLKGPTR